MPDQCIVTDNVELKVVPYNSDKQYCCGLRLHTKGTLLGNSCCGEKLYNPQTHLCCNNYVTKKGKACTLFCFDLSR